MAELDSKRNNCFGESMKTTLRKMALATAVAALSITSAQAQKGKSPPLPQPPPYGAYFVDNLVQTREEYFGALDAIAKHYGYKNESDARRACLSSKSVPSCSDAVAHRRSESAEIAKYGFKNWSEASYACSRNDKGEFGKATYCFADPFLKLRMKK